jgi:hypothetical protein
MRPNEDGTAPRDILDFAEAIAFLANLPHTMRAGKVRHLTTHQFPHRTTIVCKYCELELFLVRFNDTFHFSISVLSTCSCRGPLWSTVWSEGCRSHLYYRDTAEEWAQVLGPFGMPQCQPVAKIAKFVLTHDIAISLPTQIGLSAVAYTHTWQAMVQKIRDHRASLEDFLAELRGYRHVRLGPPDQASPFLFEGKPIVSVVWITTWARSAFRRAKYIELDCSWRGFWPFAYCIPLAIINNEAVPLGFIITPTERQLTYEWFFLDLEAYIEQALDTKPLLSDEGDALIEFAADRGWLHFFCWWHLIHKFCGCRVLQVIVVRIMRLPEEDQFMAELPNVCMQLQLLVDAKCVGEGYANSFAVFLGFSGYQGLLNGEECHYQHGVWSRHDIEDAATTAHDERNHRTVGDKVGEVVHLAERFNRTREVIDKKYNEFQDGAHRQRHRLIQKMIAQKAPQTATCEFDSCRRRRELRAHRFEVPDFPCKHTVNAFTFAPALAKNWLYPLICVLVLRLSLPTSLFGRSQPVGLARSGCPPMLLSIRSTLTVSSR